MFPKIAHPCPYLDRFDTIMDGDVCRICKRQVHDLNAMDDAARAEFLAGCAGRTCVSYSVPARPAMAAAALVASAAFLAPILTLGEERPPAGPDTTIRLYPIPEPEHRLAGIVLLPSDFRGAPEPVLEEPAGDIGNAIDNQSDPDLGRTDPPEASS